MDERQIKGINILFLFASFSLCIGLTLFIPFEPKEQVPEPTETEVLEEQETKVLKESNPFLVQETELRNIWQDLTIEYITPEFNYIGRHFITAYSPEECGYRIFEDGSDNFPTGWITSTGTIAHREEEWYIPSTCGIATDYHKYGELFLIEGKIYRAEDTGRISGAWIDLFMPDYETMSNFGSHYTEVYSVNYVTNSLSAKERKESHEYFNYYLHFGSPGGGNPVGSDH